MVTSFSTSRAQVSGALLRHCYIMEIKRSHVTLNFVLKDIHRQLLPTGPDTDLTLPAFQ